MIRDWSHHRYQQCFTFIINLICSSIPKAIHTVVQPTTDTTPQPIAIGRPHATDATKLHPDNTAIPFQSPTTFPAYVLDCPAERAEPTPTKTASDATTNLSDDMKKQQTDALRLVRHQRSTVSAAINIVPSSSEMRPMPDYTNVPNLWNMEIVRLPADGAAERTSRDAATANGGEALSLGSETSSFEIVDMCE